MLSKCGALKRMEHPHALVPLIALRARVWVSALLKLLVLDQVRASMTNTARGIRNSNFAKSTNDCLAAGRNRNVRRSLDWDFDLRTLIAVAALATLAVCAQARERVTYGEASRSLQCDEAAQKIVEAANPGGKAQNVKFAYHLNRKNHSSMWYVDFYEGPTYSLYVYDATCKLVPGTLKKL